MPATRIARTNERRQREGEGARVNSIKDPDKLPAEGLSRVNYVVEARVDVPIVYAFFWRMFWKVESRFTISSCGPGDVGPVGHEWWSKTGCNNKMQERGLLRGVRGTAHGREGRRRE